MKKSVMKTIIEQMAQTIDDLNYRHKSHKLTIQSAFRRENNYLDAIKQMEDQLQAYREEISKLNSELSTCRELNDELRKKVSICPVTEDELMVLLHGYESPINRIKIIRQITGLGLKEVKQFHDVHLKERRMTPIEKWEDAI